MLKASALIKNLIMPELPEVQTLATQLTAEVIGPKIVSVDVLDPRIGNTPPEEIIKALTGHSITKVMRRGKNLILFFTGGQAAVVHLMISGRIYLITDSSNPKGCMLRINFVDKRSLCFCYLHLGYFELYPVDKVLEEPHLKPLGPDALEVDEEQFAEILKKSNTSIKGALLNQKIVAGIGNIYVDEILSKSKIAPRKNVRKLDKQGINSLLSNTKKILRQSIDLRGTTIVSWSDLYGNNGGYQEKLRVVGKAGDACPNCSATISKGKIAGRTSYFCDNCQT